MAYIDKDAIPYFIAIDKETGKKVFIATKEYVDKAPAADVVPRAEVERLQAELDDKQFRCDSCDRIMLTGSEHRACVKQAKSEVAREIFAQIEEIISKEMKKCETVRLAMTEQNDRSYFEGGENSLRQASYWISELKKKYTEGKHDVS